MILDYRLLLYLLSFVVFSWMIISAGKVFLRWRTKYNLVRLVLFVNFLIFGIFNFLLPGKLGSILTKLSNFISDSPSVHHAIRISILVIFTVSLFAFFYYPYIKRFLARRKVKNK